MQAKPLLAASRLRARVPAHFSYCGAIAAAALVAGCAGPTPSGARSDAGWTATEVADSYVFGYPLVVMDVLREMQTAATPVNTLGPANSLYADASTAAAGWLDLAAEPVVVTLPGSRGRYSLLQANDMWTNVAVSIGSRTTGTQAQAIAFVGPGWQGELPPGVARVDSPTRYLTVNVVAPGALRGTAKAHKAGNALRVAPLSAWLGKPGMESVSGAHGLHVALALRADRDEQAAESAALDRVAQMDAQAFFTRLSQALADNPAAPNADDHAIDVLAQLGVVAGKPVALSAASADVLAKGIDEGRARVRTVPPNGIVVANGWRWFSDDVGNYGQDYAYRAYVASVLPGVGLKEDVLAAVTDVDADNRPLSGAHSYVLHFSRAQLPASAGGWSLAVEPVGQADTAAGTGEDDRTNGAEAGTRPIAVMRARHGALNERGRLLRNRDGSVDIRVQTAFPGRAYAANWLATPIGPFRLVMQIYGPKAGVVGGNWRPPALEPR
jgi:hypothetical protein